MDHRNDCEPSDCDKYPPKVAPLVLRLPHGVMAQRQMPAAVADFRQLQAGADQLEAALNQGISPPGSNSTSPSRVGSSEEFSSDDSVPLSTVRLCHFAFLRVVLLMSFVRFIIKLFH